jgi:predicted GH43/DUF377 family glycosyl hydrolase
VLFDKADPGRVLARCDKAFLLPGLTWERIGTVPNVIFLEGVTMESTQQPELTLTGYYGGADQYIGGMRIHIAVH